MVPIFRTIIGLLLGGMVARVAAILSRLHAAPGRAGRRVGRRSFVRNAALGATGVVLAEAVGGFLWFWWPNKTGAFGSEIPVPASEVPAVNAPPFESTEGRFFLVHTQDGVMAMYTKCPHLGCKVPWVGPPDDPQAFQCPCHGSMYNYVGERTGGPAPRPMDLFAVRVDDDGTVHVQTDPDGIQRGSYSPDQAVPYQA